MSFKSIEKSINDLKEYATEQEIIALNLLHIQFNSAGNANRSKEEMSEWLKQDQDVLNSFEQDTKFYENVREIQDEIIGFFAIN